MSRTAPRMDEAARRFYFDGLSREEVAAEMGITVEGVKSHLRWFRVTNGLGNRRDAVAWFRAQRVAASSRAVTAAEHRADNESAGRDIAGFLARHEPQGSDNG